MHAKVHIFLEPPCIINICINHLQSHKSVSVIKFRFIYFAAESNSSSRASPIRQEIWIDKEPGPVVLAGSAAPSSRTATPSAPAAPSSRTPYGFMDEHKANMIHTWVEKQTTNENNSVFLTQFKQVSDSDENYADYRVPRTNCMENPQNVLESRQLLPNAEHKVIIHHEDVHKMKPKPPPPPPR